MNAIHVVGLKKTYARAFGRRGGQVALAGVTLSVPAGSAFGLIGPNGAGKTTFIKAVLGIVRANEGEVKVLGGSPEDPAIRARVGYLPERLHLPGSWTALAFLDTVAKLKGLARDAKARAALLERVGLGEAAGRRIGGYSKGMRQRLGLAGALIGAPELLILDEPTDGIDPMGRMEVRRILQEEVRRGATLFLNSHLLAETERVCDHVAILGDGRVLREGRLQELQRAGQRWTARFAPGASGPALEAAGFRRGGDDAPAMGGRPVLGSSGFQTAGGDERWTVEAEDAAVLNAALDRARAGGALLLELRREGEDLEALLTRTVQAGGDSVEVAA